jgi:hypothetical protein
LFEISEILGKEEVVSRMDAILELKK